MIMVRTPFRVSFSGGGSDLREFYKHGYGAVVSTSMNKYMYVMIHEYFHDRIRIKYSKTEDVHHVDEIQHPLVRECLRLTGIRKGVEIASIADVPAGTGLGSSSAFTIGLLHALSVYQGTSVHKQQLAEDACRIEIKILKEPIGKQDQYATAMGGLNYFRFNRDESVEVETDICDTAVRRTLEKNLLLFYVGCERKAGDILREQQSAMKERKKFDTMKTMVALAEECRTALKRGNLKDFGRILHEGWLLKKTLTSKTSNDFLDAVYEKALASGALGGKLLGAGGGGFLLFYCPVEHQQKLRDVLSLRELDFQFDDEGSKVVYSDTTGRKHRSSRGPRTVARKGVNP